MNFLQFLSNSSRLKLSVNIILDFRLVTERSTERLDGDARRNRSRGSTELRRTSEVLSKFGFWITISQRLTNLQQFSDKC